MDLERIEGDNGKELRAGVSAAVLTGGSTDKDDEGCDDHSKALEFESDDELEEQDLSMTVGGVHDVKAKYSEERIFSKLVTIKGLSFEEESIGTCVRLLTRECRLKDVFGSPENMNCMNCSILWWWVGWVVSS
jgi:hypothetical protein